MVWGSLVKKSLGSFSGTRNSKGFTLGEKIVARCMFLVRNVIYFALYLVLRVTLRREVSILVYHSVDSNDSFYTVSPEEFRRQMEYLRKNYEIVSLDEITDFVVGKGSLPKRSVAITCDDGYYDNYLNIYPYFKKYGLPVAIFVATGYVGKEIPLDNIPVKMLGWDELVQMSRNNVTIGAHTTTHRSLQEIDLEEAKNEILKSKREIEKEIGNCVNYFAYPFSGHNDEVVDLVRFLGFKASFDGEGVVRQGDNPYMLNRIPVDASATFLMFKARLTMATEWYRKIEEIGSKIIRRFPFLSIVDRTYHDRQLAKIFRSGVRGTNQTT